MRAGLVFMGRRGWHLGYGWKHGALQWLPYRPQHIVVHVWNRVACLIVGHDYTALPWRLGLTPVPCCSACLSVLLVGRVVATVPAPYTS